MKLTSGNIGLPEGKADVIMFDSVLRGFALRVRRRKSDGEILRNWAIQYRQHNRQRRMNIGDAAKLTAAQAREKARKLLAQVELGGDPQGDKKERRAKDASTLRGVISEYIEHKQTAVKRRTGTPVKAGTLRGVQAYLEGPFLKPLHSMPIDRITRRDIAGRVIAATKVGAQTAVSFRSTLTAFFAWAMQTGLCESNPTIGAYKPEQPPARDRVLKDVELAQIWRSVDGMGDYTAVVRLLVLTGARRTEIGDMRWSEFNDDLTEWTLPASRSKNAQAHTLPVTPMMREIIDSVPERDGVDHLFGPRGGGFKEWAGAKERLDEKLGDAVEKWVQHDLRRSVATGMNDIGIQPHIVEQVLNHQSGHRRGVAGIYNRSPYEREVRDALLRWSEHVRTIVEGGERKVVAFPPAASLERA